MLKSSIKNGKNSWSYFGVYLNQILMMKCISLQLNIQDNQHPAHLWLNWLFQAKIAPPPPPSNIKVKCTIQSFQQRNSVGPRIEPVTHLTLSGFTIFLGDQSMADKLMLSPMMIHKIIPSVDDNFWLKRLGNNLMNQLIKVQQKSQKL